MESITRETIYETQIRLGRITPFEAQRHILTGMKTSIDLLQQCMLRGETRGIISTACDIQKYKDYLISLHQYVMEHNLSLAE